MVNKRNEDAFHILSSDANRNEAFEFLPHNCRLARLQARPVPSRDVCLSVYVTFVYCVETTSITISPAHSPNLVAIFRRGPPDWDKNRDFRPLSCFGIDDWWSVECFQ